MRRAKDDVHFEDESDDEESERARLELLRFIWRQLKRKDPLMR